MWQKPRVRMSRKRVDYLERSRKMKVNGILIAMAVISMIFVILSIVGKGSVSVMNVVTIIMDIAVIAMSVKKA